MSRSRRKTPISGITKAESDKWFKRSEHRRERRAVSTALISGEDDLPSPKQYGNPWRALKDGKSWFDPNCFPQLIGFVRFKELD